MKIAFLSHEFPPETGGGGIGTYLLQATRMLERAGHEVHVFCGGQEAHSHESGGVAVHRVQCLERENFYREVVEPFGRIHERIGFEVMEGTDYQADGWGVRRRFPGLPYVCKLHTPDFLVQELHYRYPSPLSMVRMGVGALRRGRWPRLGRRRVNAGHPEVRAILDADQVVATTEFMARWAGQRLSIPAEKMSVVPYPYEPDEQLRMIASKPAGYEILYIGRLEERKGVIDLVDAFSRVAERVPEARLRLIGRSLPAPGGRESMQAYLERRLGRWCSQVEFAGVLDPAAVARALERCAVCAFPSHWESFGLVCCEAMAAGRPLVVCRDTGMAEVAGDEAALHVGSRSVPALSQALLVLLENQNVREEMGRAGRRRVSDVYAHEAVLPRQVMAYEQAIERCRQKER